MTNIALLATVLLSAPIVRGDTSIETLQLRKPSTGELRGLNLLDIGQLKVDALITLIPRISQPHLTEAEVMALDVADIMAIGVEIATFLLPEVTVSPPA